MVGDVNVNVNGNGNRNRITVRAGSGKAKRWTGGWYYCKAHTYRNRDYREKRTSHRGEEHSVLEVPE